ncbi:MAG TPA: glycosyltransferase [Magnetospirillaceae bacterium]|jgi:colanic acid/amylovoran biosynthesis glycosyltransferase
MRDHTSYGSASHGLDTDLWGELGNARKHASNAEMPLETEGRQRPLRIAMFVNEFPALSETFILNQITGLLDLGHDVTIFSNGPRNESAVHADVARYNLRDRTRYRPMPKARSKRLLRAPGILVGDGRRHFAKLMKALDASVYGRDALSLNMFYWCAALFEEEPFDIIHCHFGLVGRIVAYFREIGAIKGKLVVTFHGVDVSACLDEDPNLYRELFRHLDLALPISNRWRQRLIAHGCDPSRINVHHMGIDPTRFTFELRSRKATQPLRILTIGRLVEKKGVEDGLRAVANLIARRIPAVYTIAGNGPLAGQLANLANELKIGHHVDFCGWQTQDEVAQLLRQHDVLLAPSVTDAKGDQEGIPVTIMEAMASGLPVVSTLHSGIPELVEHDVSGLLVAEHDVDGLGRAMESLWVDSAMGKRLSIAAHDKVMRDYNVGELNRVLVERYQSILETTTPSESTEVPGDAGASS